MFDDVTRRTITRHSRRLQTAFHDIFTNRGRVKKYKTLDRLWNFVYRTMYKETETERSFSTCIHARVVASRNVQRTDAPSEKRVDGFRGRVHSYAYSCIIMYVLG